MDLSSMQASAAPICVRVLPPAPARLFPGLPAQNTLVIKNIQKFLQSQEFPLLNLQSFPNTEVSYSPKAQNREITEEQQGVKAVTGTQRHHSTARG